VVVIPLLYWVPPAVSAVLLTTSWIASSTVGIGSPKIQVLWTVWFLIAVYLQFFTGSIATTTVGLVAQSILAIYLVLRIKGSF